MKKYLVLIVMVCSILISCKPDPKLPTVTTNAVSELTSTSAVCGGEVTDNGNADITAKGICWGTNQNPTLNDNYTSEGTGESSFTSTMSDLTAATTYYVRAYATNSEGTAYGNGVEFTTLEEENNGDDNNGDDNNGDDNNEEVEVVLPTVSEVTVTDITSYTVKCKAEVMADGGAEVTARGFIWTCTLEPDADCTIKVDAGAGMGKYECEITDLEADVTYYVWAFARNSAGMVESEIFTFTTLPEKVEPTYEYVDLGLPSGVKWAAYNLGATTPEGFGDYFAWGEITTKSSYESSNCSSYYQDLGDISGNPEYDVVKAQWGGDWRMPKLEDMYELVTQCTWIWANVNGVGGYNVVSNVNGKHIFIPASGFMKGEDVYDQASFGYYWTSTPYSEELEGGENTNTKACYLDFGSSYYITEWGLRRNGFTVRPVMD